MINKWDKRIKLFLDNLAGRDTDEIYEYYKNLGHFRSWYFEAIKWFESLGRGWYYTEGIWAD